MATYGPALPPMPAVFENDRLSMFGIDKIYRVFAKCKTVVSVGSGTGKYEAALLSLGLMDRVYCVDPSPRSFDNGKVIQNDYKYVRDLIKDKPELVGTCTLLLFWPEPENCKWDIEAIGLLKPTSIISMYEASGSAGGIDFHRFMAASGHPNTLQYHSHIKRGNVQSDYRGTAYVWTELFGPYNFQSLVLSVLERNGVAGQVTELNPGSPKGIERTRALWAGYKMFGDTTTWEQFMSERAKVGLTEDYGY